MDLRAALAAQNYTATRPATAPSASEAGNPLGGILSSFSDTLRHSEETAMSALSGGADPHALVQALAQTELAVETAVTVRNKVVEAYQEILRMPV